MSDEQFDMLMRAIESAKWTEITSAAILIASFVIGIGSLYYARRQLLADHKRSQRQLAMEMCSRWAGFTSAETASVTRLIEQLDEAQCDSIAKLREVSVPVEQAHHLVSIFLLRFPNFETTLSTIKTGDLYVLDGQYVLYLRHIAVRYLNMLESILTTWTMGIADQKMIESEFGYLLDEEKGRTAMERLRAKIGRDGFPAIESFMTALREKKQQKLKEMRRPALI